MSGSAERPTEVKTAEEFFQRLAEPDATTIRSIVETINRLAEEYGTKNQIIGGEGSYGFFGVYAIGGNITKQGERPDVDLLIATNASWDHGYYSHRAFEDPIVRSGDWVAGTIQDTFENQGYRVELLGEIPFGYEGIGVEPKAIIRLTSQDASRKQIDIVYVKTTFRSDIKRLADFEAIDVDSEGKALPRVELLINEDLGQIIHLRA